MIQSLKQSITHRFIFLFVLLLTTTFYGITSQFDFVWDDYLLIVNNPTINRNFSIGEFFSSGLWNSSLMANTSNSYYRPIVAMGYELQFKLFGMKAGGFHLVSLMIHCLNLFFLWMIAIRFQVKTWALFFLLMIFSFHPVQVSAISFISCQGDLWATLFMLIAVWVWLKDDHSKYLAFFPTMAALLCKETAVLLPVALLCYDLLVRKYSYSKFKTYLPILILAPYFLMRKIALGAGLPHGLVEHWYETRGSFRTLKFIGRILFPIPMPPEDGNNPLELWKSISCHVTLLTLFVIGWFNVFKNEKLQWLFVWFLFGLMPIADWPGSNLRFSDQLLYVSMAPAALLFGFLFEQISQNLKVAASVILVPMLILSQNQIGIWKNSETLWSYALSFDPKDIIANANYGAGLYEMGRKKEACDHNYKALVLTLENPNPIAQQVLAYNLGKCYEKDHPKVAEKYYRAAVDISRGEDWASVSNLGFVLLRQGDLDGAEKIAQQMILQHPGIFYSWKLMGQVQQNRGSKEKSLISFHKALKLNPSDREVQNLIEKASK